MTNLKIKLIVVLSLACVVLTITFLASINNKSFATVSAQQNNNDNTQNQSNQRKNSLKLERPEPIDEAALPASDSERVKRNNKNRRYDKSDGPKMSKKLTELPTGFGSVGGSSESESPSALPVAESEAVLLGTITSVQPYLSENKTSMYTEFTFHVEGILKASNVEVISEGSSIKVDREAGAMRLANGKTVYYDTAGIGKLPQRNKKYVLFLKRVNDGQDLSIVVGYELRNGKVFPLEGINVFSHSTKTITRREPFVNIAEADFLQIVRDAIANPNKTTTDGGVN